MKNYDHHKIEKKWSLTWQKNKLYQVTDPVFKLASKDSVPATSISAKPKFYVLDMFPYPSGQGLHVGHPRGYIATDIVSRYKRMNGFNVLHPMGWDAFGLPAEQYAIKHKIHPRLAVEKNIARYKEQLSMIGFDYDWSREINTTDPEFYKFTQWIFLELFKKGLAYESYEPINWCPSCQTGLANEDLENGLCERCGSEVEQKPMRQWVLRITDYADRLLYDLDLPELDWQESAKAGQRNWIGRSEGSEIDFEIKNQANQVNQADQIDKITVFTTKPETISGATFIVLAPEHSIIDILESQISNWSEVVAHREKLKHKTERERTVAREKNGLELCGIKVLNPVTKEEIPVWIADYVLPNYGTGAVMAVPIKDERDAEFAEKYNLPVKEIVDPNLDSRSGAEPSAELEVLMKSRKVVRYKLQDWVFSRQRYWGEPIPIIHCSKCGAVPVAEKDLPVILPEVESYEPTGTGESPLAAISEWVNTICPVCSGPSKRETNTMPQWAGSSWYYLRYMDPHNENVLVDAEKEKYWSPVDLYVGGAEHITRHLIYARFWHKFLYDIGVVSTVEPFLRLRNQGVIVDAEGRKMSKRWGNVVNPDDVVETYGADTLRLYEIFLGPFDQIASWNTDGIMGPRRFLERVWRLGQKLLAENNTVPEDQTDISQILHQTIKKISQDIENMSFNTAVSSLMILINEMEKRNPTRRDYLTLIRLLAPFAPFITEEIWHEFHAQNTTENGEENATQNSVHFAAWPKWDQDMLAKKEEIIAVQFNGKIRGTVTVASGSTQAQVETIIMADSSLAARLEGQTIKKKIFVSGKLLNFVVTTE